MKDHYRDQDCIIHHYVMIGCKSGYIYLATNGKLCKIGCTAITERKENPVQSRLSALNREEQDRYSLVVALKYDGCIKTLEKEIHDMLAVYRVGAKERFSDPETVTEIVSGIKSFHGKPVLPAIGV